ncbi:UNVERIFIED_CONTAM: hypothetical protein Slati_0529800 [Sesamum latifolium]|uniref:Uncharacterized protein n=1 Tax=Sesamum latifolium TaxID=2727402 RepID=A0AAW2Y0Q3_9LAMI
MELQSKTSSELDTTTAAAATAGSTATATDTVVGRVKTSIHVTALDGIVNVNSLFTMAIFIGFSLTVPEAATAAARTECTTSRETVRRLIVFEVVSFSFFLFSSLIAQSLKLAINLINNMDPNDPHKADIDPDFLKYGLFGSAIGSVMGCLFLMLSIVDSSGSSWDRIPVEETRIRAGDSTDIRGVCACGLCEHSHIRFLLCGDQQ